MSLWTLFFLFVAITTALAGTVTLIDGKATIFRVPVPLYLALAWYYGGTALAIVGLVKWPK